MSAFDSLSVIDSRTLNAKILAHKLCIEEVLIKPPPNDGNLYCNATFDTWGCWNYTLAGEQAVIQCPLHIFPKSEEYAHKDCEDNGTWRVFPPKYEPWSNYSQCSSWEEPHEDNGYIYVFIAGYCLSLILLTISLVIFFAFRQLRCERITIHKNLFFSYLFTGITWILYFTMVVLHGDVIVANPTWCRGLHIIAQYCTVCNFAWMFCEGVYLHTIMVQAFRSGKTLLICCIVLGWSVPLILTAVYAGVRGSFYEHSQDCWIFPNNYQWILFGPVVASVVINICLLINIIRLLITKLRQIPEASQSKKAARATLILVPLFGLQYLIFPVQPAKDSPFNPFYHYFIAMLTSLQGALVSIMYCFCNGEVLAVIRRKWHQHQLMTGHMRKNTGLCTTTTYTEAYSTVQTSTRDLSTSCAKAKDTVEMKPLQIEQSST
ncbi:calcitonin gene-related peptide type 1 receptor isoform X2 [Patella vulgata]|uniref:calcitonin gene-related peptide type 1 receptor isoform X2 n=1 Tax=Patella vulgata TaxID=6465 RepID=UPI002180669B|nr:calcitonin gene-related peptide type 1 receptor isoform X2 [Patella vulgata]